ncbi:MAG: biotin--[acetyl-CoA-carboxylase] ligase [Rikenellaceae bacterium]|nr:biotin--[acetyl-CoA-carboxylase] ligase [Rikenellaceae bacterium]
MFDVIYLNTVESTNDTVRQYPPFTLIWADNQTNGRGQRGNTWESEPGANLTFSFKVKPQSLRLDNAFALSEAVALAVVETLHDEGVTATVKWPNDIYVDRRKICGILIENSVGSSGAVNMSVTGVGLNVNQKTFSSNAPNPVSMFGLKGREFDREALLASFCRRFETLYGLADGGDEEREALHVRYMAALYRKDGFHDFADSKGPFCAKIASIASDGMITLERRDGQRNGYYFKEVEFLP